MGSPVHRKRERGGSAVEFALTVPILLIILIGIFDVGRAFLTKQALTTATREGARMAVAARPVTDAEVTAMVQSYLNDARVKGSSITIDPGVAGVATGTAIKVRAETEMKFTILPMTMKLSGFATMVKE